MTEPTSFSTTFSTESETGTVTVAVHGDFESATVTAFESAIGPLMGLNPKSVVLDLSRVTLIDSAAIGAMLRLRQSLSDVGTELRVHAPLEYQQRLFRITGLLHILAADQEP